VLYSEDSEGTYIQCTLCSYLSTFLSARDRIQDLCKEKQKNIHIELVLESTHTDSRGITNPTSTKTFLMLSVNEGIICDHHMEFSFSGQI
jgi:hypothetical protein